MGLLNDFPLGSKITTINDDYNDNSIYTQMLVIDIFFDFNYGMCLKCKVLKSFSYKRNEIIVIPDYLVNKYYVYELPKRLYTRKDFKENLKRNDLAYMNIPYKQIKFDL